MNQCVVDHKRAGPRCRKYIGRRHEPPVLTGLTVGMIAIGKVHDLSKADFRDMVGEAKRYEADASAFFPPNPLWKIGLWTWLLCVAKGLCT